MDDFSRVVTISSFVSNKALIESNIGISFLYEALLANEHNIGTFTVDGITEPHVFHVVCTRNTSAKNSF